MRKIVVGVDGSEGGQTALRWALVEARGHSASLHAVHVWNVPYHFMGIPGVPVSTIPEDDLHRTAEEILDEAMKQVEDATGGVHIIRESLRGSPVARLVRAAEDADLLVLGSRGLGGFRGLMLGSVSQQCAHHAACPVVIVPSGVDRDERRRRQEP